MCLILFAWNEHPDYQLILAANRDEFHERKTKTVHWWKDHPSLLAGKDLQAGGTWMGITRSGKFAAVTNYRQFPITEKFETSRGDLVKEFLIDEQLSPKAYLDHLHESRDQFEGYNLIFGNSNELYYYSNKGDKNGPLKKGVYGLSNHLLDTPWPKVVNGKAALKGMLNGNASNDDGYFSFLNDPSTAPDRELPDTGVGLERERWLSAMFIDHKNYGTRSSYLLRITKDGYGQLSERSYVPLSNHHFSFQLQKEH